MQQQELAAQAVWLPVQARLPCAPFAYQCFAQARVCVIKADAQNTLFPYALLKFPEQFSVMLLLGNEQVAGAKNGRKMNQKGE